MNHLQFSLMNDHNYLIIKIANMNISIIVSTQKIHVVVPHKNPYDIFKNVNGNMSILKDAV